MLRRALQMLIRCAGWLAMVGGGLLLLAYGVGRAATDRWMWTQFVFWTPAWLLLAGACLAWGASLGCLALSRAARSSRVERRLRWVLGAATVLAVGHWLVVIRVDRLVNPPVAPVGGRAEGVDTLRILHWNAMSPDVKPSRGKLRTLLSERQPDILLFTMALAPHQFRENVEGLDPEYQTAGFGLFSVASRLPIVRAQSISLNLSQPPPAGFSGRDPRSAPPSPNDSHHWLEYFYNSYLTPLGMQRRFFRNSDPGSLLALTFDGGERFGRPIVVYFIDLPSDPLRSKWELAGRVRARIDAGLKPPEGGGEPILPPPDFIVGDFNIPRDSASLTRIGPGMGSAYGDAGGGLFSTWPRISPLIHLDQMLRSPAWRCVQYQSFDAGEGDHRGQDGVFVQAR